MFKLDRSFEKDIKKQGDGLFRQGGDPADASGNAFGQIGNTALSDFLSYQVSSPDDPCEIEADHKADQVMAGAMYRDAEVGADGGEADLPSSAFEGGGESMPEDLQGTMEGSFGRSFSNVRVHTDSSADSLSRSIQAKAFTKGDDIYFKEGAYQPDSFSGRHLIAHELTHVAQGDAGLSRVFDLDPIDNAPRDGTPPNKDVDNEPNKNVILQNKATLKSAVDEIAGIPALVNAIDANAAVTPDTLHKYEKFKEILGSRKYVQSGMEYFKTRLTAYESAYRTKYVIATGTSDPMLTAISDTLAEITNLEAAFQGDKLIGLETTEQIVKDRITLAKADPAMASNNEMVTLADSVRGPMGDVMFQKFTEAVDEIKGISSLDGAPSDVFQKNREQIVQHETPSVGKRIKAGADIASAGLGMGAGIMGSVMDVQDAAGTKSEETGKKSDILTGVSDAVSTTMDTVGMVVDAKELHDKEKARQQKIDELGLRGKVSSADHAERVNVASEGIGVVSGAMGVAGDFMDEGTANDVVSTVGSGLGLAGDALGMGADSAKVDKQRKQDAAAKKQMVLLCGKLRASLHGTGSSSGSGTPPAHPANADLESLCTIIEAGKNLSTKNNISPKISAILGNTYDPPLTDDQKKNLKGIEMLQVARQASRGEVKDMKLDIANDVIGTVGDIADLIGSCFSMADNKVVSAVFSVISTVFGLAGSAIDAYQAGKEMKGDSQADTEEKRGRTQSVSVELMNQLRALPLFPASSLSPPVLNGTGKVTKNEANVAQQYAEAFTLTKTTLAAANMDMISFLFACKKDKDESTGTSAPGHGDRMKNIFTRMAG